MHTTRFYTACGVPDDFLLDLNNEFRIYKSTHLAEKVSRQMKPSYFVISVFLSHESLRVPQRKSQSSPRKTKRSDLDSHQSQTENVCFGWSETSNASRPALSSWQRNSVKSLKLWIAHLDLATRGSKSLEVHPQSGVRPSKSL